MSDKAVLGNPKPAKSELKSSKMSKKLGGNDHEKSPSPEEQRTKINDVKKMIGPVADKFPALCSDASILRYLRARNWSVKKSAKMLKETMKWRLVFKPEKLRWEDIAHEAQTGKIYKANYFDRKGRTVIVVRPGFQNTSGVSGQIKHLVYSLENAIMTMNTDQEQMVWLVDFQWWTMACISVKVARETLKILQDHYPERLGVAILFNPPKVFESFWTMMKPFIEPKTHKKVNFVYYNKPQSRKIMEEIFDMDKLECAFGGRNTAAFDYEAYATRMKQEDKKFADLNIPESALPMLSVTLESQPSESLSPNHGASCEEDESSSSDEVTSNLELLDLDEETQEQTRICKDAGNAVEPVKETQDQPCSCQDIGNADASELVKEVK